MTAEQKIASLVVATSYSATTVRKWWKHIPVRRRTHDTLQTAAKKLNIRRPRATA